MKLDALLDKVHCMDAIDLLRMLPDESVNCVVTSPPYFGLRDYGTATWQGGEDGCDHAPRAQVRGSKSNTNTGALRDKPSNLCQKCGAIRIDNQIGLEDTPRAFVDRLVSVFAEVRRVLRSDGVLWVNMGDSYSSGSGNPPPKHSSDNVGFTRRNIGGLPDKSRLGIPHRLVFALQDDGYIWRDEIVWAKPNPMPESVTDRTTKAHEFVFMLTKEPRYWYDNEAIKEDAIEAGRAYTFTTPYKIHGRNNGNPGTGNEGNGKYLSYDRRNKRSVWNIIADPTPFAHFATFPQALIEPMILAGCPKDGVVLDPFMGSGTTAIVARRLGRHYIGSELNPEYAALANNRLLKDDVTVMREQQTGFSQMSMFEVIDT